MGHPSPNRSYRQPEALARTNTIATRIAEKHPCSRFSLAIRDPSAFQHFLSAQTDHTSRRKFGLTDSAPAIPYPPMRRHPNIRSFGLTLTTTAALFAGPIGCHKPDQPEGPTVEAIENDQVDSLWAAAESVLRKHDFQIDRQDRAVGVLSTLPTTSQQFFEVWRQDVADPYSLGQASLHTMPRRAQVRFVRDPAGRHWTIDMQVDVYRLSTPEHQVTSASSALLAFSGALPTATGQIGQNAAKAREWVHLGRDGELESRLLSQIFNAAGRTPIALDLPAAEGGAPPATASPPGASSNPTPPACEAKSPMPIRPDGELTPR